MKIQNDKYVAEFILEGAQLVSLKDKNDGTEFIHDGKKGWGQHNPTLFPIVGKLKGGKTIINGKPYEMGQHGVVRRAQFELCEQTDTSITFKFEADEESLSHYTYKFTMYKSYELVGNELTISHRIVNDDNVPMVFSIGHHPAFKCPLYEDEKMSDYHIEFECEEDLKLTKIDLESGLFTNVIYVNEGAKGNSYALPFDIETLNTLVFENLKSSFVSLVGPKHKVSVSTVAHPFYGIWHVKDENFICLEPWLSHSDTVDSDGIFENKVGMITLEAGKSYLNTYSIRFE
ncbi:MAG: aldose 1-epimerase family protein [Erysipelotrichales bacterium]|nr:aldose 1-epimerase family protein [Erysipelotrichales bacterium]